MSVLTLLQTNPLFFLCSVFVLGLLIGSFLNVVIYRLPVMMERDWARQCAELRDEQPASELLEKFDLIAPRSRCPHCNHLITAIENIPVLSYLFLRGRCRNCHQGISSRYPIIELVSASMAATTAWYFGANIASAGLILFGWCLLCLTMIDFDTQYLPDSLTLPFLWLGLLFNLFGTYVPLADAVLGAIAGYLSLWSVFMAFKMLTGKEGMGYGDFKLLAMLGAWLGWQALPVIIMLSSIVGAGVGISLMAFKSLQSDQPIPFGPYLAGAGWLALFWGDDISRAYLKWAGLL